MDVAKSKLGTILMEINKVSQYEVQFMKNDIGDIIAGPIKVKDVSINELMDKCLVGTNLTYTVNNMTVVVKKQPQEPVKNITVKGRVTEQGNADVPLVGAYVLVVGTKNGVTVDVDGNYTLSNVPSNAVLQFSFMGFKTKELPVNGKSLINTSMEFETEMLEDVVVTGFQNVKKENFTGASVKVNADQLSVKGLSDVSRMLEGSVAGVTIQNVSGTFGSAPKVRVRGSTSINGENKPLWVIDGVIHEDIVNVSNDDLTSGDPSTLLGSAVAGLNSNDIESIDILKDASATALYGARAMNGVIVVTTKRGKSGKPKIQYSGNFTIQLKPTYADYDIMNSVDQMSVYAELERKGYLTTNIVNRSNYGVYGKMYSLINAYDESTGKFGLENTVEARKNFLERYAYANTDWFGILFKNSFVNEHSLSISGGSEKSTSYASLSFYNDEGWTMADAVNRYTANLRNDFKVTDNFRIGVQVVGSVRQQKAPGTLSRASNVVEGSYDRDFDINPFSYALNTSRALTAYDEDGNLEYFQRNYAPFNIINELQTNGIKLNVIDLKGQLELGWNVTDWLKWDFTGALRYVKSDREHEIREGSNMAEAYRAAGNSTIRENNGFLYTDPDNPNAEPIVVLPYGGFYNRYENQLTSIDFRNTLSFTKEFGKHYINALVGQQVKYADRQIFSMTGYGYQYDQGGVPFVDYKIMKQMIEGNFDYYGMSKSRDRFAAFYANADYTFDKRYVLSGTVRYEGSNNLGKNRNARWLPTWNVSAKWNVNNETFMKSTENWLDYLSLRVSYGLTASMPPAANASAVFYNESPKRPYTNELESVIVLDDLANAELTWEKGKLLNIGADFSIFQRRFDFVIDYWRRNSFDLIGTIRTSGIGGESSKYANYADMKSHGIDIGVGIIPVKYKGFEWKMNLTYGLSKTEITDYAATPRIYDLVKPEGGNLVGYPARSLFSIEYKGLNPDTGIPEFIDEAGKQSSKVYLQSTEVSHLKYEGAVEPTYVGGIGNNFKWKNLSVNVFFTFQGGNKIRLNPVFKTTYTDLDAMSSVFLDRWLVPGEENVTNVPSIVDSYIKSSQLSGVYPYNNYNYSDQRVAKGDFMRLKNVSLTYTLPSKLIDRWRIFSNLSVTLAATNLCLIYSDKKLNGQDPEFFNSGGVAQPLQRQFTMALNIGF